MATTKSRHSISTQNKDFDDSVSHSENELLKKKTLKNTIAERKLDQCITVRPSLSVRPFVVPFSYIFLMTY